MTKTPESDYSFIAHARIHELKRSEFIMAFWSFLMNLRQEKMKLLSGFFPFFFSYAFFAHLRPKKEGTYFIFGYFHENETRIR